MPTPNFHAGAEARSRALIDRGLLLLGDALHGQMQPHLERVYGPEWSAQVSPKRGRFGRRDLASYAQCLFGDRDDPGTRQVFRAALGVPFYGVDRALRQAVWVRNRFAHPDGPVDLSQAQNDIGQLLVLAQVLKLECVDELQGIAREAKTLSFDRDDAGRVSAKKMEELQHQAARSAAEVDRLRQLVASSQADQERAHDELVRAEQALHAAEAAREDLESRTEFLRKQLADAASDSVVAAQLKQQLHLAEQQAADQAQRLAGSERERAALSARLEAQARNAEEAERRASEAESQRDELAGSIAFRQALVEPEEESTEGLVKQLQGILTKLVAAGVVPAQQDQQELPAPGEPWPFARGEDVWTLSRARRSLVTYDGRLSLDELWPRPDVERLVDALLQIRPEGGRVWIDDDGDATTYVDGVLTYLGPVVPDPEGTQFNDPPIGTPYPPAGNRYSITRAGIQRLSDGAWLAAEIDAACAEEVRKRLRAVRRSGGRYRVNATGAATTCVAGEWVFAGRVRAAEWFPGDVTA